MIPQFEDSTFLLDDEEEMEEEKQPSLTFCMNDDSKTIGGMVDGLEAVAQSIRTRLQVEMAEFEIYDETYGVEFAELFGKPSGLILVGLRDTITDACLEDDRVEDVGDFSFTKIDKKSICVTFSVDTVFGMIDLEEVASLG